MLLEGWIEFESVFGSQEQHAKIKKMPVKQRKAARQKVRAALKQREQKVRKDLPARVSTPGELAALMKRFRVMKV